MQEPQLSSSASPLHILVADDDRGIVRSVAGALRRAGYEVTEANDGAEALARIAERAPDLAIVDLNMPRIGGIEVVRELKASHPTCPVLVFSGSDDVDDKISAFDVGADDFIEKPFHMRELIRRIDVHARNHRSTAELERLRADADHLRMMASEAAALLAHDLNNGLAVVKANLEFVLSVLEPTMAGDDDVADAGASGKRALLRMITLVRNFVDISRMEDAALRPARTQVCIADIVRATADIHMPRRRDSLIDLVIDVPEGLLANVDGTLVERILHNLFNNSARYVNRGGRLLVRARVEQLAAGQELRFVVANTGPSIPAEIRASLFEKYAKGSDRRAQSGMGLYFCRLASEAHGGAIGLVDEPGFPVGILVRLPCGAVASERGVNAIRQAS